MERLLILLAILFSTFSAAVTELQPLYFVFLLLNYLLSAVLFSKGRFYKGTSKFIWYAFSPFLLSLLISLPINYLFNYRYDYHQLNIAGSLINLLGLGFFFYYTNNLIVKRRLTLEQTVKFYYYSCCIMLVSAIWHALSLYANFPIPFPLETRSFFHSGGIVNAIAERLTGIAQEPSYLASYLVDFWVLCYFLFHKKKIKKYLWRGICVIIIALTFSPSAYISLLCVVLYEQYSVLKIKTNKVIGALVGFLVVGIVAFISYINYSDGMVVSYFFNRLSSIENSMRFNIIAKAAGSIFQDNNYFALLFGNGFQSFELLKNRFSSVNAVTSNSLYIDVLFECGLIGLSILISFLTFIYRKLKKIRNSRYRVFGLLLLLDIVISSFYRADYASLRFIIIIVILFNIINQANVKQYGINIKK